MTQTQQTAGEPQTLEPPAWRSMLFVPVTVPRFVATAADRGADAVILDLEDAVAAAEKPRARTLLAEAVPHVARRGADVLIRVNRPWRLLVRDLEAAVLPGVAALMLTKVDSPEHVQAAAEVVAEMEAERGLPVGRLRFVVLVETAAGFFRMEAIARAHPRIVALSLGAEDFAASVGMLAEPEGLLYPKQHMLFAARAAGVLPLGFVGSIADFRDQEAFRVIVRRSRRLGFVGAACIHPLQVPVLNEEFAPPAEEVERAARMVAAYDAALASGAGAVQFEGKMIDIPVVERAKTVLARDGAIRARQVRAG
ncbi:MAG: HpcH/HpaI aldolase/citrate lyase family protein [Acetobacteraceae bacterium]